MSLQMLSTVWGAEFIETFKNATVRSLAFPENKKALENATWNIFTDESSIHLIDKVIEESFPDIHVIYRDLKVIRDRVDYLHSALIWQIKECIKTGDKFLLAPPDTIFGDKTIPNLIGEGADRTSAVFVPHPRVLPDILKEKYQSNAALAGSAMRNLHRSWSEAEEGFERQNSFIGGVSWRRVDDKTISVKHLLPTPYYMEFTPQDLDFFETSIGFGNFDHVWPSTLVNQGRIRYIGSSDVCFVCEVTEADKNLPPVVRGADTSQFWRNHPHNIFNSQIRYIMRGE